MTVKPFAALRPDPRFVSILNVPPYDVVTRADVEKAIHDNPYSFFHITRADACLPGEDEHSEAVYRKGRENLERFIRDGVLKRDAAPGYYVLSQTWKGRTQTGLYAAVSCEEYGKNQIKKHELTRKDKEEDRTRHITVTGAGTGPVFLAFEKMDGYDSLIGEARAADPDYHFTDEKDVENKIWAVSSPALVKKIEEYFKGIPALYIADGHHRAASAYNVYQNAKKEGSLTEGKSLFMAVIFPSDELAILPYNRVVTDLNGLTKEAFLAKAREKFDVEECQSLESPKKGDIRMYLSKSLYRLTPLKGSYNASSPLESLDVSILQKNLLSPVLGIDDPRVSKRIQFVGGVHGTAGLMKPVDGGEAAVAFSLYPVSMDDLMAIVNEGGIMPPKSTWFEPKLRDGVVTYIL